MHAAQLNKKENGPAQLTVTGTITDQGSDFGLGFAIRRQADPQPVDEAAVKWLAVDFLDGDRTILLTTGVPAMPICAFPDRDSPPPTGTTTFLVNSLVPLVDEIVAMVVRDEERVFVERKFVSDAAVIDGVSVKAVKDGVYSVDWSARHPSNVDLEHVVMVSQDGGETWRPTTLPVKDMSVEVVVAPASGVKSLLFAVLTTDGLNTVSATAKPIDAIPVPPQVAILTPDSGTARSPLTLVACTTEPGGVPSHRISWTSSADGEVAKGMSASATLSSGAHTLTVSLLDASAKPVASDYIEVVIV